MKRSTQATASSPIDPDHVLESMTQSVLITTPQLEFPGPFIIYANRAFEKMTGWSRDEIIGKDPRILQGPNTDLTIFRNLRDTLEKGRVWKGRTINYKKDGTEFYMEWSITPLFDQAGKIYQLLAVQNDITENVEVEIRLEKTRRREKNGSRKLSRPILSCSHLPRSRKRSWTFLENMFRNL